MKRPFLVMIYLLFITMANAQNQLMLPVKYSEARITSGFWAERVSANNTISIPYLLSLAEDSAKGHVIENFKIAAGLKAGEHAGTNWQDEWLYKWIEAACYVLANESNDLLQAKIDEYIQLIAKAQVSDGYIATQVQANNDKERFDRPSYHEFYNMGHLMTAAAVHYKVTGKTDLLKVAEGSAKYLYSVVNSDIEKFSEFPYNPSAIMGAVDLYRVSGNKEFLNFAKLLVDLRGYKYNRDKSRPFWTTEMLNEASDQNQNFKPLRIEDEVLGHAVFFTYLYSGAADVFMETGDRELLVALERLWNDLVSTKMYITGGIGPEHKALVSRFINSGEREQIMGDVIHEGISGPYDLPNSTAYNETCGQIGNFMWNWRMLKITGNPKYAELMELSIYNSILSGVELDGTGWYYTNPLTWNGSEHIKLNKDAHKRYDPGREDICCPTNLTRTLASFNNYLYAVSEQTLWVHHYAGSELNVNVPKVGNVKLTQSTNYPFEGSIDFEMEEGTNGKEMLLKLRIPEWANGAFVTVNKEKFSAQAGSYIEINRSWEKGDYIHLELPMQVRLLKANPKFENLSGDVALKFGPLVYCLESIDIKGGYDIENIYLPIKSKWKKHSMSDLHNFVGLRTNAVYIENRLGKGNAYIDIINPKKVKTTITMIPYFAWNNRDEPKMRVWLPAIY